jgi:hypothetical protein
MTPMNSVGILIHQVLGALYIEQNSTQSIEASNEYS